MRALNQANYTWGCFSDYHIVFISKKTTHFHFPVLNCTNIPFYITLKISDRWSGFFPVFKLFSESFSLWKRVKQKQNKTEKQKSKVGGECVGEKAGWGLGGEREETEWVMMSRCHICQRKMQFSNKGWNIGGAKIQIIEESDWEEVEKASGEILV